MLKKGPHGVLGSYALRFDNAQEGVARCAWFHISRVLTALKKGSHGVLSQVSLYTPRFDNAQEGVHGVQN